MRFGRQSLLQKCLLTAACILVARVCLKEMLRDAFWWPESASKSAYGRHPRAESFDPRHMLDGMQTVKAPAR